MAISTKAQYAEKFIRSGILNGTWKAGDSLPSEHDMIERLGVSRTTLRHALSALANEGLVVPQQGLGTFVSDVPCVGMVAMIARAETFASTPGFFQQRVFEELGRSIDSASFRSILSLGQGNTEEEICLSTNILDKSVVKDVVGVVSYLSLGSVEKKLKAHGIPSVTIETLIPVSENSVVLDYRGMVEMAVRTLRDRGYEDFTLMRIDNTGVSKYKKSYIAHQEGEFLVKAAVNFRDDRLLSVEMGSSNRMVTAYEAFKDWWNSPKRTRAIFFYDDSLCDVVCRAILEMGIRVPEDLAVITHANTGRDFHFPVELTRMEFDPVEVSAALWRILNRIMTDKDSDGMVEYVRPVLKEGESLG